MIKKFINFVFPRETEYTKKWIARFTWIVFILLLFYPFLSQELLYLHFENELENGVIKFMFEQYSDFAKVLVTGYATVFITSMAKAFLGKHEEEKIALERERMYASEDIEVDADTEELEG